MPKESGLESAWWWEDWFGGGGVGRWRRGEGDPDLEYEGFQDILGHCVADHRAYLLGFDAMVVDGGGVHALQAEALL